MKHLFILIIIFVFVCPMVIKANEFTSPSGRFGSDRLTNSTQIIADEGEIYIIEPKMHHVVIFSETGEFIMNLGRAGEGPGENKMLNIVSIFNGRIYFFDWRGRRIHLFSQKNKKYLKSIPFTETLFGYPPYTMDFHHSGTMIMLNLGFLKDTPLIGLYTPEGKPINRFFNAAPSYKNIDAYMEDVKKNGHANRESQKNKGFIAVSNEKIYYANIIENKVIQLDLKGNIINDFLLPIPSHEKTLSFIKISKGPNGILYGMENELTHDLKKSNGNIYILCRHKNISYIFQLEKGKFREVCKMKENISKFDIMDNKIYCLRPAKDDDYEDNPEVLVYNYPQN